MYNFNEIKAETRVRETGKYAEMREPASNYKTSSGDSSAEASVVFYPTKRTGYLQFLLELLEVQWLVAKLMEVNQVVEMYFLVIMK